MSVMKKSSRRKARGGPRDTLLGRLRRLASRRITPPAVPWPPLSRGRTRVLLECAPEHSPAIVESILERAGYDVVVCEGPEEHRGCPMVDRGACSAVPAVDVVVNMLGDGSPRQRAVIDAVLASESHPPVVAMVSDPAAAAPGFRAIGRRSRAEELVAAIEAAVDDAECPVP